MNIQVGGLYPSAPNHPKSEDSSSTKKQDNSSIKDLGKGAKQGPDIILSQEILTCSF